jgi:rubrerythrin
MERFVHRQNIEHYREMLKTVTDPAQREKIEKLLAEEEVALREAEEKYKKQK